MEQSFNNRSVLAFESRRAKEIWTLIETFGGRPVVAPAMREVPRESDDEALGLADGIERGDFDAVVFLTGVGVRALLDAADRAGRRARLVDALRVARVIVRGPKPAAVLRDLQVAVWANAPEPNTWRVLMDAIEARAGEWTLQGARVAVQEYGVSNTELLDALRSAGARVTAVPTYQWAMPEDVEPLRNAARALHPDVVLPHSRLKHSIAEVLKREGYLAEVAVEGTTRKQMRLKLRFAGRRSVIEGLKRLSSPGRRMYASCTDIPKVRGGLGVIVLSTSAGVVTDREARRRKLGGELLCSVW